MNVRSLFSKWLFVLLIVASIFAIGSIDAFAGEGTGGATEQDLEYTILKWRRTQDANYNPEHFYNKDILCSSSTRSSVTIDDTMDETTADALKCNTDDPTIHKYVVWKMLDGAQPFVSSGDMNSMHSSFSQSTYLFTVLGNSNPGWKEYNNKDNNGDGTIDTDDSTNTGFKNANMQYVILYLHRMSKGHATITKD